MTTVATNVRGEVIDADSNGFTVRSETTVAADRLAVYVASVANIGEWWSSDHTVSGNAHIEDVEWHSESNDTSHTFVRRQPNLASAGCYKPSANR